MAKWVLSIIYHQIKNFVIKFVIIIVISFEANLLLFSSPVNFACCTASCQRASNRTECRRAVDDHSDCLEASYCKYPFYKRRTQTETQMIHVMKFLYIICLQIWLSHLIVDVNSFLKKQSLRFPWQVISGIDLNCPAPSPKDNITCIDG